MAPGWHQVRAGPTSGRRGASTPKTRSQSAPDPLRSVVDTIHRPVLKCSTHHLNVSSGLCECPTLSIFTSSRLCMIFPPKGAAVMRDLGDEQPPDRAYQERDSNTPTVTYFSHGEKGFGVFEIPFTDPWNPAHSNGSGARVALGELFTAPRFSTKSLRTRSFQLLQWDRLCRHVGDSDDYCNTPWRTGKQIIEPAARRRGAKDFGAVQSLDETLCGLNQHQQNPAGISRPPVWRFQLL